MMRSTTASPWARFEPTPEDPWDLRKVAHLHRRAGFGATWTELERDLKAGPAASVERLLQPRPLAAQETVILGSLREGVLDSRDIIFFLSVIGFSLFATSVILRTHRAG